MTIEALIKAVPPPASPTYTFDGPWEPIEAQLGTPLPQDYKDLVRLYGFGTFMGHLSVNVPTAPYDDHQLLIGAFEIQGMLVEQCPNIRMYPQPGGLLTCGSVHSVDYLLWLTRGPVDEWPIVICERLASKESELEVFEFDLTGFLAGMITGEIPMNDTEENIEWLRAQPAFKPYTGPDGEHLLNDG